MDYYTPVIHFPHINSYFPGSKGLIDDVAKTNSLFNHPHRRFIEKIHKQDPKTQKVTGLKQITMQEYTPYSYITTAVGRIDETDYSTVPRSGNIPRLVSHFDPDEPPLDPYNNPKNPQDFNASLGNQPQNTTDSQPKPPYDHPALRTLRPSTAETPFNNGLATHPAQIPSQIAGNGSVPFSQLVRPEDLMITRDAAIDAIQRQTFENQGIQTEPTTRRVRFGVNTSQEMTQTETPAQRDRGIQIVVNGVERTIQTDAPVQSQMEDHMVQTDGTGMITLPDPVAALDRHQRQVHYEYRDQGNQTEVLLPHLPRNVYSQTDGPHTVGYVPERLIDISTQTAEDEVLLHTFDASVQTHGRHPGRSVSSQTHPMGAPERNADDEITIVEDAMRAAFASNASRARKRRININETDTSKRRRPNEPEPAEPLAAPHQPVGPPRLPLSHDHINSNEYNEARAQIAEHTLSTGVPADLSLFFGVNPPHVPMLSEDAASFIINRDLSTRFRDQAPSQAVQYLPDPPRNDRAYRLTETRTTGSRRRGSSSREAARDPSPPSSRTRSRTARTRSASPDGPAQNTRARRGRGGAH